MKTNIKETSFSDSLFENLMCHFQWWIQDFPDGGCQPLSLEQQLVAFGGNLLFGQIYAENCI